MQKMDEIGGNHVKLHKPESERQSRASFLSFVECRSKQRMMDLIKKRGQREPVEGERSGKEKVRVGK
jgi:hypothetical protein